MFPPRVVALTGNPQNMTIGMAALLTVAARMVVARVPPRPVLERVDWVLLLFFAGLFVGVALPGEKTMPDPRWGFIVLAMASTWAGNLRLLGGVANLIV